MNSKKRKIEKNTSIVHIANDNGYFGYYGYRDGNGVTYDGDVYDYDHRVDFIDVAVRRALWIELDS